MKVSRRFALLFILASLLASTLVSTFIGLHGRNSDNHLQLIIALLVLLVLIIVVGKLFYFQQELQRAKQNLDESQRLAALGSWERDLLTGKGYWSDNHYRLFNIPPRAMAPDMEEFFSMVHPEDRQQARDTVLDAIRSNDSYEIKYRLDGDLSSKTFLSRGKVLQDDSGKPVTLVGTVQDITHRQRREQFREGLLKQKDLFINRLGHDLKTPLTPLVALLPLIRSRTEEHRQQELLDLCINSVDHINDLVAKTLMLARLTSSTDALPERFDIMLSTAVDAAVSAMAETVNNAKLSIENLVPAGMAVRGNQQELEELFSQLISNTAKFSPQGSAITFDASRDNGLVTVVVSDNGIGLLPGELGHIFDDFYKADHSRHMLNSSGLGLTICRRIVENHGGRIWASSPGMGCGTTISFTLEAGGNV